MNKVKIIIFLLFALSITALNAAVIDKAFSALKVYNYFEAKRLFEKLMPKEPAAAAYGLSTIYSRNDNPFFDIDTAYKYVLMSDDIFQLAPLKVRTKYAKFTISQETIDSLKNDIYQNKNTIPDLNKFITHYVGAPQHSDAIDIRNHIAFINAKKTNTYNAYQTFISTYPKAKDVPEARELYESTFYKAYTKDKTLEEYENYLQKRPNTPFLQEVEDAIYSLSTKHGTIDEYHNFVKKHPKNRNIETAWRNIYTIYTSDYKTESLVDFKLEFPDYPYSDVVNQEIALSQKRLYGIRENGKWGFADSTGKTIIACMYEWVEDFSEGVAECGLDGKAGFINKSGKEVIPFNYDEVEAFYHGMAVVVQNGKSGIINKLGKIIVPLEYDDISVFSEGFAAIAKGDKYGYIDETGKLAIPMVFSKASDFSEGFAAIEADGQSGYINTSGKIVIPCIYEWVDKFSNGIAKVKAQQKFGVITKSGTPLLSCEYDVLGEYVEDAILVVKDNKYGFADESGKLIIPIEYDYNSSYLSVLKFKNGYAIAEKNKKQGLINKAGKYVTPKDFIRIDPFNEGLAAVKKKDKWGYIDEKIKVTIPYNYSVADEFRSGMAKVTNKNGKVGFIDKAGKTVIEFQFDEVGVFKNNWCTVAIDGKTGVIDYTGSWILPCELDALTVIENNILRLEKNAKFAYYNISEKRYVWKEQGF